MRRKSFSGWLRRCYSNICLRSRGFYSNICLRSRRSKVALGMAVLAVGLVLAGFEEDHREVNRAEQQITLASPLSASGNTASVTYTNVGWWGNRLVISDLFANQR